MAILSGRRTHQQEKKMRTKRIATKKKEKIIPGIDHGLTVCCEVPAVIKDGKPMCPMCNGSVCQSTFS